MTQSVVFKGVTHMLFAITFSCTGGNSGSEPAINNLGAPTVVAAETKEAPSVPPSVESQPDSVSTGLIERNVYFTNQKNFQTGQGEFLEGVAREFTNQESAQAAIDQIYKGPSDAEKGLVLTHCGSTGATLVSVNDGLAFVQLAGGCFGCGTHSIYDSLRATLVEWPDISDVVLFGPNESINREFEAGKRPLCLEP